MLFTSGSRRILLDKFETDIQLSSLDTSQKVTTVLWYLPMCIRLTEMVTASRRILEGSPLPIKYSGYRVKEHTVEPQISLVCNPVPLIIHLGQHIQSSLKSRTAAQYQLDAFISAPDCLRVSPVLLSTLAIETMMQADLSRFFQHHTKRNLKGNMVHNPTKHSSNHQTMCSGSDVLQVSEDESPWLLINPGKSLFELLTESQYLCCDAGDLATTEADYPKSMHIQWTQ